MDKDTIRLLRADEIECRVGSINEKGLALLLFKDACVDQKILDETFTPFGWRRSHQSINGSLYCTVEIWDGEKQQWIAKQDVGTESYSEKEKGQASDSFKRACFNWGIGRELYTAPFIWVPSSKTEIQSKNDRHYTKEHFHVQSISYNGEREVSAVSIINSTGRTVFEWQKKQAGGFNPDGADSADGVNGAGSIGTGITAVQMEVLKKELDRTGITMEAVLERYGIERPEQMTPETYKKALSGLKRTKPKKAA